MPPITTATFFPPPTPAILNPGPLTTLIVPLPTRDGLGRQFESVLVAVLGNSVANNHARIIDGPRDGQHFEISLGKIAERVEVVHFVFNKKKSVFGIVGRGRGADDHAGGIRTVTGDAVRGAGVATKCAQVSDGECWLAANTNESAGENGDDCTRDPNLYVHERVVVAANLPLAKKTFADKPKYDESSARVLISVRALTACERTACAHLRAREKFLRTNMPSTEVILTDNVPGLGAEADV
jgi:hypothetical protein